jgi:hypothetical protein
VRPQPRRCNAGAAEFRKVNGRVRTACKDFVVLCKELDLLGGATVGNDGSFIHPSASDACIVTKSALHSAMKQ